MANRLSKLRLAMAKRHLDAVLISSVPNITYLTNFSRLSKDEREAFLFVTTDRQYILTDGRYSEAVKNNVEDFKLIEISAKLTFEKVLKDLAKKHKIKKLGIEERNLTVKEHKTILRHSNDTYHYSVDSLRIIKERKEIANIQKACELGDKTFKYILNKIKLGISEKELAFEIEFFIKKNGADISFPPIVAFGKNSAFPHHKPSNMSLMPILTRHSGKEVPDGTSASRISYRSNQRDSGQARMTAGQFVLLDFGVRLNNYCSDMTRTVFFGKTTKEQKRMYQTVLEAQKRAIEQFNNLTMKQFEKNIKASEIDRLARSYIISQGYPPIPHSLGHGIGLEVHESPRLSPKSKDILKPGMVFTIEPGIYIPGFGGVRIEDVVVLEKSEPSLLTKSPKEIIEI